LTPLVTVFLDTPTQASAYYAAGIGSIAMMSKRCLSVNFVFGAHFHPSPQMWYHRKILVAHQLAAQERHHSQLMISRGSQFLRFHETARALLVYYHHHSQVG